MDLPGEDATKAVASAAGEMAKTTGKVIDATRDAGGFLGRILAPALVEWGASLHDRLRAHMALQYTKLETAVQAEVDRMGDKYKAKAVPFSFGLPLPEAATLEEDDEMQAAWARLLANATNDADETEARKAYIEVLAQMSALDVRLLNAIYSVEGKTPMVGLGVATAGLPEVARQRQEKEELAMPSQNLQESLSNLVRLGCLKTSTTWAGHEVLKAVLQTVFGRAFVRACRAVTASD